MKSIYMLVSDACGVYVPQKFAASANLDNFSGIDPEDVSIIAAGPDGNECYWDAWHSVLNNAVYTEDGYTYRLHQDGDLWLICDDLLTQDEYRDFYGEDRPWDEQPVPRGWVEHFSGEIGSHFVTALEYGDTSGLTDDEEAQLDAFLADLPSVPYWEFGKQTETVCEITGLFSQCTEARCITPLEAADSAA